MASASPATTVGRTYDLVCGAHELAICCANPGSREVRQVNTGFQIFSIRSDGQELRQLTNSPGNNAHAGCSPDGEWILFASDRMGFKDEVLYTHVMQPQGEIFVMRYDGSNVRQLTDNQSEDGTPAWQPDPQVRPRD
jgi:Tol biopolymer transport system component